MKINKGMKRKRIAVMFMAAILMINIFIMNLTVIVSAEEVTGIAVAELDMGEYSDTMTVGDKQLLSVTVLPLDATNPKVNYSSSNNAVASINGMGRIEAIDVGTTVITATCQGKSGSFTLIVKGKEEGNIPVEELDLGEYESQMEKGTSQILSVTALPTDATDTKISYTSSNTSVATVNGMGRISALKIGKTTIKIKCNEIQSSIEILVVEKKDDTIEVTDVEIANHEDKVKVGETVSLSATVLPSDATNATVTYESSNEKIATVNSSGEVKGIGAGTVTITIKAGKITKKETINVVVATKSITMNNNYLVLKSGDTFTLFGTVLPSEAVQSLTYKSINPSVATVSTLGKVTAVAVGNTSIMVSNGDYQAAVSVIVNTSEDTVTNSEENNENLEIEESVVKYDDVMDASKSTIVDKQMLKYLYENKTSLIILGNGYRILVNGNDIVNYQNELSTDIQLNLSSLVDEAGGEGRSFVINENNPICGEITLFLDDISGKYLYLYNEPKEQYELIKTSNLTEISISTPGKYLITDSKIRTSSWIIIVTLLVGGALVIVGIGVYIVLKKQYWFW